MIAALFKFGPRYFFGTLYLSLIRNWDGEIGIFLRYRYYKKRLKYLGKNVIIDTNVHLSGLKFISLGDGTHIDKNVILVASPPDLSLEHRVLDVKNNTDIDIPKGEVIIGENCHLCQNTMVFGYGGVKLHDYCTLSSGTRLYSLTSLPFDPKNRSNIQSIQPYSGPSPTQIGPIELEKNVWLGLDVNVFPGVKIGKNSFVRSRSLVKEGQEENSYISGDPATKKGLLFK